MFTRRSGDMNHFVTVCYTGLETSVRAWQAVPSAAVSKSPADVLSNVTHTAK